MSDIDTLLLTSVLSSGLQDHDVTDDVLQTSAVSQVLGQLANTINAEITQLQGKISNNNKEVQQLIKVGQALTEALQDKASPQPLPQQDMNATEPAPEQPVPQEQSPVTPAPDAGMVPPPEMNVPPAPDMGVPAPDTGMQSPAPDMMQFDPSMIGAVQQGF